MKIEYILLNVLLLSGCKIGSNEGSNLDAGKDAAEIDASTINDAGVDANENDSGSDASTQSNIRFLWVRSAGGENDDSNDEQGNNLATDSSGNIYLTGLFFGDAVFGKGEANETILQSKTLEGETVQHGDIFIAKYTKNGDLEWAKSVESTGEDFAGDIITLPDGGINVAGAFGGTAIFGKGEENETELANSAAMMFLARYSTDGKLTWAKKIDGSDLILETRLALDTDGNIIALGNFSGEVSYKEPNQDEMKSIQSSGMLDVFIAKYDSQGNTIWMKNAAGGSGIDKGYGIAVGSDNSIFITGHFYENATFGTGEVNEIQLQSGGDDDIFIAKYDTTGSLVWAKRAGGSPIKVIENNGQNIGYGIVALSDGSVVVTGSFRDTAVFGQGEANETTLIEESWSSFEDVFIARYNGEDGTLEWARSATGGMHDRGYAVDRMEGDSTVITGLSAGHLVFGKGEANETTLRSNPYSGSFIAQYNPDGTLAWAENVASYGINDALDIKVTIDHSLIVAGRFIQEARFDDKGGNETTIISEGYTDIFLAKYGL